MPRLCTQREVFKEAFSDLQPPLFVSITILPETQLQAREDIEVTKRLVNVGKLLGLNFWIILLLVNINLLV